MIFITHLKGFFDGFKMYFLATRDDQFKYEIIRGLGVHISSPTSLRVFVGEKTAAQTLHNLKTNKLLALSATATSNHASYQLKGTFIQVRPANSEEKALIHDFLLLFEGEAVAAGFTEGAVLNTVPYDPALMIEFEVEQIFDQTPKVDSGKLLTAV